MIPFKGQESLGPPRLLSRKDLVEVILRMQSDGWRCALRRDKGLTSDCGELYLNGRLYQGMIHIRNMLGLTNIFLVEKPGVRAKEDSPMPQGEPDVIMLFSEFGAYEPHAVIECKRLDPLENPKRLRREYVRSGIDRFINGPYGRGHNIDFMVGYVLRGTGPNAMDDINGYLKNVGRIHDLLQTMDEYNQFGFVARSEHVRMDDGERFRLLHNLVCF